MEISMKYDKRKSKSLKSIFSKKRIAVVSLAAASGSSTINEMDSISNRIALMPNFIHSMDSTNIQLLISNYVVKNKEINLFTIHDCFATTPDHMKDLNKDIRLTFLNMYFHSDYIKSVRSYGAENLIKKIYYNTKVLYEKDDEGRLKVVSIKDIDNISNFINVNKEYIIKIGVKEYTIPSLPYDVKYWDQIKIYFEGILNSNYFIN